jgi:hypothetical protein
MFCEKITNQKGEMRQCMSCWSDQFFPPSTNQVFLSSLPSDNIPCSPSGHEVESHDKLRPHNKKTASLPHWTELSMLFWVLGDIVETHCEDWAFVSIS